MTQIVTPPMFTAIHHARQKDMIFVWYTDGTRKAFKTKHKFYTPNIGEYGSMPCGMYDIYGKEVFEVSVDGKTEMDIRNKHNGRYNHISECDIDFKTRWLQTHYKEVDEIRFNVKDFNVCFLDIEVATEGKFPTAEDADYPVNCVSIHFSKNNKYYVFGLNREINPSTNEKLLAENCEYINCYNEVDLLSTLFQTIGKNNVDIITGWNLDGYDMPYLYNRSKKLSVDIREMCRLPADYKEVYMSKRDETLKIAGTEVIDYLKLYKKFSRGEKDNYKLDTIGSIEVGENKAELPDGYLSWKNYWDDFVWYNFKDTQLVKRIDDKCRYIETTIGACSEARVSFGSIFESKKVLVGFLLNFLHKRRIVMPPLREFSRESFPGAFVYSTPGYYESLVSYDYRSMYPSIMMGANISPETKVTYPINYKVPEEELKNLVRSPWTAHGTKQVYYRKDKAGIIPEVVKILFDGRTELKNKMKECQNNGNTLDAEYYDMKQNAYKIFGNSLYGLLGNPYFQFYDIDNSASVTAFGVKLITDTLEKLNYYFENDLKHDAKYFEIFNQKPNIDETIKGSYINQDGDLCYRRMSHGDTDSFFVKCHDIYEPYKNINGKELGIYVFDGNQKIYSESYNINEVDEYKLYDYYCSQYSNKWKDLPDIDFNDKENKKNHAFKQGIFFDKNIRIILNRYTLTDYCRIIDAGILEDKLADIMQNFANYYNFYKNTLFLKREKCIHQAIVTAKKKYICYVESNEDIRYDKAKFAITGLEIVRSSTTPFSRENLLSLIDKLMKTMDKKYIKDEYLKIKEHFFQMIFDNKLYDISIPSGVKATPPIYNEYINWSDDARKKVDWRLRSASVWNHLITNDEVLKKYTLEPIAAGSKVKFIKVMPNDYNITVLAYVGKECPKRLFDIFTPDWDDQWIKTFSQTMDRLFDAVGWGKNFENDDRDLMLEIF